MDHKDIIHKPAINISSYNRTLCCVLEEMRTATKTLNFSYLLGLIEEVQTYANRMECKLTDVADYTAMKERYRKMKESVGDES